MLLKKWLWLLLAISMMTILFFSSNTPYQNQDVKPLFKDWITITESDLPPIEFMYDGALITPSQPYSYIEFFIRKGAHVLSFGLLAFSWLMYLRHHFSTYTSVFLGSSLTFLYALLDEFHQSMTPNRTGHLIDVLIPDSLGIALASLSFLLATFIKNKE